MRRGVALCLLLAVAAGQDASARVKDLVSQLGSPDEETRATAAHLLGKLGPHAKNAIPALAKALGDESYWVSRCAFDAIKSIGPDCVPVLVKSLDSKNVNVRASAMRLLDECFYSYLKPHLRVIALRLRDENADVRKNASHALGGQREAAIDLVIAVFGAREREVGDAAIAALVMIGGPAIRPVVKVLSTGSGPARVTAARALGALKAHGEEDALLLALSDESRDVAGEAARSLGQVGTPEKVVPRLVEGFRDASATVRDGCVDGLAACGGPAVPALTAALGPEDTREYAARAFLKMEQNGAEGLGEALTNESPEIRSAALATLGRFHTELVSDQVIQSAVTCLNDKSPAVRAAAARVLGSFGARCKTDKLKECVADKDLAVRAAAVHALGEIGVDPKETELGAGVEAILANWKIWGGDGGSELSKIAFDAAADAGVRAAAIRALGEMGLGAPAVDLTPLLEKQPVEIRRAAARAVAAITQPCALAIRDGRLGTKRDKVVDAGLRWLLTEQGSDGEWEAGLYTSGVSGLALLSLLTAGCGPGDGEEATAVRRGLLHLVRKQTKHGILGNKATHAYFVCHGIATMALIEGYMLTGEFRWRRAAQRGLDHIAWARNPGLAWRYDPRGGENDTHVTTWTLFATRLGDAAGLRVDRESYAGGAKWIESMTDKNFGVTGYNYPGGAVARPEGLQETYPPERSHCMTAAALWCRHLLGGAMLEAPVYQKGASEVLSIEPRWSAGYEDMLYWHFAALAFFQDGDAAFKKWAKPLQDALLAGRQANTGAWQTNDLWARSMERDAAFARGPTIYATSIGVLTLLTPTRYPRDFLNKPKHSPTTRAAIAALKKACGDEDAEVREIATAACARLGG